MNTLLTPIFKTRHQLPLFTSAVRAGFPSPAEDHIDRALDITELLVSNPPATFYLRVAGDSMMDAGIYESDILVVDRSITAQHGDIVVAELNAEFTVKRLYYRGSQVILHAENQRYPSFVISQDDEFSLFGVVSGVVRQLK